MNVFPLSPAGTLIAAIAIFAAILFRDVRIGRRTARTYGVIFAALVVVRIVAGMAAPQAGWMARYYANEHWAGVPEYSTDFPGLGATRIDPRISFANDTFPAYYLNDASFHERGERREFTIPMSVEWTGYTFLKSPGEISVALTALGTGSVQIDGHTAVEASATAGPITQRAQQSLSAGLHRLDVKYVKPPNANGLIDVAIPLDVTPAPSSRTTTGPLLHTMRAAVDVVLLILAASFVIILAWTAWPFTWSRTVTLTLFVLFCAQGWWRASGFAGKAKSLTPYDDWFGYESNAREALSHGLLMTFGSSPGHGAAYFNYPLYSYFVAGVHAVTGESLFGPVFVQFLILAAVAVIMWHFVAQRFGELPALAGVLALVLIFELDFIRYYTVNLFSEDLYILPVTLTVVSLGRWVERGRSGDLVRAAFWGGISTITRVAMMFYFIPALALIAVVSAGRPRPRRLASALGLVGLAASVWLLVISPVTLRNWFVSHKFVLVVDVPSRLSDFMSHLPPALQPPRGGLDDRETGTGLKVLARVVRTHPVAFAVFEARSLGFSAGMTQWFGYRPHPEMIGITLLYLAMLIAVRGLREGRFWPMHLFVAVHMATMLTTSPWNYGYRLIIPAYVYTSTLSVAALASLVLLRAGINAATPLTSSTDSG